MAASRGKRQLLKVKVIEGRGLGVSVHAHVITHLRPACTPRINIQTHPSPWSHVPGRASPKLCHTTDSLTFVRLEVPLPVQMTDFDCLADLQEKNHVVQGILLDYTSNLIGSAQKTSVSKQWILRQCNSWTRARLVW